MCVFIAANYHSQQSLGKTLAKNGVPYFPILGTYDSWYRLFSKSEGHSIASYVAGNFVSKNRIFQVEEIPYSPVLYQFS